MLRIPHCLDNRLTDGGEAVSPTHRPHSTPQKQLSKPQGLVQLEGLGTLKQFSDLIMSWLVTNRSVCECDIAGSCPFTASCSHTSASVRGETRLVAYPVTQLDCASPATAQSAHFCAPVRRKTVAE
jgi:hypothetical protein